MTALEKAVEAVANTASDNPKEANFRAVARAVLLAVREPDDRFMLHMYPNPTADVADGGRAAGARSRRAGRMQIARLVDAILSEPPTKTPTNPDSSPPQ